MFRSSSAGVSSKGVPGRAVSLLGKALSARVREVLSVRGVKTKDKETLLDLRLTLWVGIHASDLGGLQ